jgi:hypothetical protein
MATYYLNADTGVDTGAGGSGAPWKTLVYAVAHSTTGDTLYCQNSTATFDFRNTTITNRTITGQSVTGVIFDGAAGNYCWSVGVGTTIVNNIWIKNLIRTGTTGLFDLASTTQVINLTINNLRFSQITLSGSYLGAVFGFNGWPPDGVITIVANSCILDDIQLTGANSILLVMMQTAATASFTMNNCVIRLNTATYAPVAMIGCNRPGVVMTFRNTIFKNNLTSKKFVFDGSNAYGTISLVNCDYYGTWADGGLVVSKTNCITSDPLFVDENNGDFHLRPTSPCIDTGTTI